MRANEKTDFIETYIQNDRMIRQTPDEHERRAKAEEAWQKSRFLINMNEEKQRKINSHEKIDKY